MKTQIEGPEWLQKLWERMLVDSDNDVKLVAGILVYLLLIELRKIKKIEELANKLPSDYQLTRHYFLRSDDFFYD